MDLESIILSKLSKNQMKHKIELINHQSANYFYLNSKDKYEYMKNRLIFMKKHFLDVLNMEDFVSINFQSTKSFYTYGFISTLNGDKIENDVYLFNTIDQSNNPIKLNLSNCPGYSLFNGQVLALRGKNGTGEEINVEKIYCFPSLSYSKFSKEPLLLRIFKGPFTVQDINVLMSKDQGVIILMGPFIDYENSDVDIEKIKNNIEIKLEKLPNVSVIMVPSSEDCICVYPQPSLKINSSRILSVSNPCFLNINSHYICINNFDSILDLSYEEFFKDSKDKKDLLATSDKLERLSAHLIFQQNLVPILNSKSSVAYGNWLNVDVPPHILITSSMMKHFSKKSAFSHVINIGSQKGQACEIIYLVDSNNYSINFY